MCTCPPAERLRRLLAEELDAADRLELEEHVEACQTCQECLERWTADGLIPPTADCPPDPTGTGAAPSSPTSWPEIPGFDILGILGRGGMGIVYQARQLALNRHVALKMLRAGDDADPETLARFRREAEAVARLQHPNVVQIHEVGEYEGRPYFALELVDGGSLDKRWAGTPQPARQVAELIETLARAVQAAHVQGIVHRDLKPANVLLTATGVPKVTDFGLAKRLDPALGVTQSGVIMGTPSYMAPEQGRGENKAVGPAADGYALGAMLYEGLTGRPPFKAESALETLQQVLRQDPVAVRALQPKVPRDLETICLKCLHKEPGRRYASAQDLAEDLRRFRAGEPITARPTPTWERALKWARRRPAVAALLGLGSIGFLVLLAVWLGFTARLQGERNRANDQRAEAIKEFRRARDAVDKFLTNVSESPKLQGPDLRPLRLELLASAKAFYEDFVNERRNDRALRADLGMAYCRLGTITAEIGSKEEAVRLCRQGLDLLAEVVSDREGDAGLQLEMARGHRFLGLLYLDLGQTTEAEVWLRQALSRLESLVKVEPDNLLYQTVQAASHEALGMVFRNTGRFPDAEKEHQVALTIREFLAGRQPGEARHQSSLCDSYNNLADLYEDRNQIAKSEQAYQKAIDIQRTLVEHYPATTAYRQQLAWVYNNLGKLYCNTRRFSDAEAPLRKGLELRQILVDQHPSVNDFKVDLASSHNNLGAFYMGSQRYGEAEKAFQSVLRLEKELADRQPNWMNPQLGLGRAYNNLAAVYWTTKRFPEAEESFHKAVAVRRGLIERDRTNPEYPSELASTQINLGHLYQEWRRTKEARQAYREALELCQVLVHDHPDVVPYGTKLALAQIGLANVAADEGHREAALPWYAQALQTLEPFHRKEPGHGMVKHILVTIYYNRAGILGDKLHRYAEALSDWEKVIELEGGSSSEGRFGRAYALAQLKHYGRATDEIKDLLKTPPAPWAFWTSACVYALSAAAVSQDAQLAPAEQNRLHEEFLRQAMAVLQKAQEAGYFKDMAHWEALKKDADLDVLRGRDDFQKLLSRLEHENSE